MFPRALIYSVALCIITALITFFAEEFELDVDLITTSFLVAVFAIQAIRLRRRMGGLRRLLGVPALILFLYSLPMLVFSILLVADQEFKTALFFAFQPAFLMALFAVTYTPPLEMLTPEYELNVVALSENFFYIYFGAWGILYFFPEWGIFFLTIVSMLYGCLFVGPPPAKLRYVLSHSLYPFIPFLHRMEFWRWAEKLIASGIDWGLSHLFKLLPLQGEGVQIPPYILTSFLMALLLLSPIGGLKRGVKAAALKVPLILLIFPILNLLIIHFSPLENYLFVVLSDLPILLDLSLFLSLLSEISRGEDHMSKTTLM